jgi:hypothetical protein
MITWHSQLAGTVAQHAHATSLAAAAAAAAAAAFNKMGKAEFCGLPTPIVCSAGANKPTLCPAALNNALAGAAPLSVAGAVDTGPMLVSAAPALQLP